MSIITYVMTVERRIDDGGGMSRQRSEFVAPPGVQTIEDVPDPRKRL
jgi:hypothetical protein